jgi:K+ potassium transporter
VASVEGAIDGAPKARLLLMSLAALGIVFGDIGTSPLYTFKTILNLTGSKPDTSAILGSLSLVLWALFIITTVKYVSFAMRVNNDGEGGILALMSLLVVKKQRRPIIVALGLFRSVSMVLTPDTLLYGVEVRPAYEPSALPLGKCRTKASRTSTVALCTPVPRRLASCWIILPARSGASAAQPHPVHAQALQSAQVRAPT